MGRVEPSTLNPIPYPHEPQTHNSRFEARPPSLTLVTGP